MRLVLIIALIFLINIPFGYWRSTVRRLSPAWFLAIHIPIPVTLEIRMLLVGWDWALIPIFVAAYAGGQFLGAKLNEHFKRENYSSVSSCLVMDVYRRARGRAS